MYVEARNLNKTYKLLQHSIAVLKGASLDVKPGESVAVIGKSGAGKSTLLHVLGGIDSPDEGSVMLDKRDLYKMSNRDRTRERARRIGFVFQSYHLLPEMDILENVMLSGFAGECMSSSAMIKRAGELLSAVGLSERAFHRPMELSGGEQQRAAIARALMNNPELVLADEPTGNLDEATGTQVLDHLFELTANSSHTLILVTHNEKIASRCDRCMLLDDGILLDKKVS